MNNTCPSCGVLYNVAAKDIGRRLKCKKCQAALTVTEAGLVEDTGEAPGTPQSPDLDVPEDGEPTQKKRKRSDSGSNPLAAIVGALSVVGGIPGLLFGIGVLFVLFFTFMQVLAAASIQRAVEYEKKLELDEKVLIREKLPKGKHDPAELTGDEKKKYDDDEKKIRDEYIVPKKRAQEDKLYTEIGNKRSKLYEGYGAMLGFVLVSFGCLGFLRTQEAMLLRIVAGIILTAIVLGLFRFAIGTGAGIGAGVNIG